MTQGYPKQLKGLCIGVLGADRVLLQGPPDTATGGYKQKLIHLSGLSAPKLDSAGGKDEKYGYAGRQLMRELLVGKEIEIVIEKKVNEVELGRIVSLVDGKDPVEELLYHGYAKLRGIYPDTPEKHRNAETEAREDGAGLWLRAEEGKEDHEEGHRFIAFSSQKAIQAKLSEVQTEKAIVEEVFASRATLYFPVLGIYTSINYSTVQTVILSEQVEGASKNNARAIRSYLESSFLNRDVDFFYAKGAEGVNGYFKTKQGKDVRKVLLQNGFAKLGKDSMNTVSAGEFVELKRVAEDAMRLGKGLWKDQKLEETAKLSNNLDTKSQAAFIIEVHSGDCLSVSFPNKSEPLRLYLPHVRSPALAQPLGFQAKQALRKRAIGEAVRVEMQCTKKFAAKREDGSQGEMREFTYASIFIGPINLACYMLECGFVTIQQPRIEDKISNYFEQMRDSEEKGKKAKKGLHAANIPKSQVFNDISGGRGKKPDPIKSRNLFSFIKDQSKIHAVVELVLNGSRFKVRLVQNNAYLVLVIDGVRCLPNEAEYTRGSEQALQYSRAHILQRDIQVDFTRVDQKGVFHGQIFVNREDYAERLLEYGLAYSLAQRGARTPLTARYESIQETARKSAKGIWRDHPDLSALKGDSAKRYKPIKKSLKGSIIEVVGKEQFYIEPVDCKRVNVPQQLPAAKSVKVGDIVAAPFSTDGVYYRARIARELNSQQVRVVFIDYGNYDTVARTKICSLSEDLTKQPGAVLKCSLFGIESLTLNALKFLTDSVGIQMQVELVEQIEFGDLQYRAILNDKDLCLNVEILASGDGQCSCDIEEWIKAEQEAKKYGEGKWADL